MWPFDSLKNKLKNQDAMEKYREWMKKWFFRGAKFYAVAAILVLVGTFALMRFVILSPTQPVFNGSENKPAVTEEVKETNINEPTEQSTEELTEAKEEEPEPPVDLSQLIMPVSGNIILGYHQPYYSEVYNDFRFSDGLEFNPEPAAPVKAALPGKVISTELDPYSGFIVTVDHGQGYMTTYTGLNNIQVSANQQVDKGDILGTTGTEDSQLVHPNLRFTLTENGKPINPL